MGIDKELSRRRLKQYAGGEMEWRDIKRDFKCHGGIEKIEVQNNTLHIRLSWSARGVGGDNTTSRILNTGGWVEDSVLDYSLPLVDVTATPRSDHLLVEGAQEIYVFLFARDGKKFDQTRIRRAR